MKTYIVAFIPTRPLWGTVSGSPFPDYTYETLEAPDDEMAKKIFQEEYSHEGFDKRHVPPRTVALYKKMGEIVHR